MKQLTRLYLETDVCGWCYALLVLHVGNEEEGDLRMPQMCSVLVLEILASLLTQTVAFMGAAIKHPMPDRVKPSFVIFYICTL